MRRVTEQVLDFNPDTHQICWDCKEVKKFTQFGVYRRNANDRNGMCKRCNKLRSDQWRDTVREQVDELKLSYGCTDCGYADHPEALQFDHLPGYVKMDNVSRLVAAGRKWSTILAEIQKCEVVCANCHAVRTCNRRTNNGA